MFISKKKFNLAIENAKRETEKDCWENQRINQFETEVHRRIDRIEERVASIEDSKKGKGKVHHKCPFEIKRW